MISFSTFFLSVFFIHTVYIIRRIRQLVFFTVSLGVLVEGSAPRNPELETRHPLCGFPFPGSRESPLTHHKIK
jgi:hypothetical protein